MTDTYLRICTQVLTNPDGSPSCQLQTWVLVDPASYAALLRPPTPLDSFIADATTLLGPFVFMFIGILFSYRAIKRAIEQ